jgi:hypothetical protein
MKTCKLCGEEIGEALFYPEGQDSPNLCSACQREEYEDMIGYEDD